MKTQSSLGFNYDLHYEKSLLRTSRGVLKTPGNVLKNGQLNAPQLKIYIDVAPGKTFAINRFGPYTALGIETFLIVRCAISYHAGIA